LGDLAIFSIQSCQQNLYRQSNPCFQNLDTKERPKWQWYLIIWLPVINLLWPSIDKINAKWYTDCYCQKYPPSHSFLPLWILTLFLGYWLTVQCLECCSHCRISRITDKHRDRIPGLGWPDCQNNHDKLSHQLRLQVKNVRKKFTLAGPDGKSLV
jgi:hypothetical protein